MNTRAHKNRQQE